MDVGHDVLSPTAQLIWLVGTPIVFIVGVIGNIITIVVFRKPKNRSSTSVYLVWLALMDLIVILVALPRWWVIYLFHYDFRHYSDLACKLHQLAVVYSSTGSSYVLMALTIERLISTVKPHQVKILCTSRVATNVCIGCVVALIVLSFNMIYGYGLSYTQPSEVNETQNATHCIDDFGYPCASTNATNASISLLMGDDSMTTAPPEGYTPTSLSSADFTTLPPSDVQHPSSQTTGSVPLENVAIQAVCSWYREKKFIKIVQTTDQLLHLVIGLLLPELVFVVADVIIVYKLSSHRKSRSKLTVGSSSKKQSGHVRQITITLVSVNVIFMLCKSPLYIFLSFINTYSKDTTSETVEIWWAIINFFFFLNHGINFVLYVLIGERFRNQVLEMLSCWKSKALRKSPSSISTVSGRSTQTRSSE